MPTRDKVHAAVKQALINDGWTITHDPLQLPYGRNKVQLDLGAEKMIAAEKDAQKIAVEIKSFLGFSLITEFYAALGQVLTYRVALTALMPERILYLAVPIDTFKDLSESELTSDSLQEYGIKLIVFSPRKEVIIQWIS